MLKLISHCNSRFEARLNQVVATVLLKEPVIEGIKLSDLKLDISDIEEDFAP